MLSDLLIGRAAIGHQRPDLRAHADLSCRIGNLSKSLAGACSMIVGQVSRILGR